MDGNLPAIGPGLRSILRNGSFQMGITLAETGLRAFYIIVLSHFITATAYGIWVYSAASYTLAMGMVMMGFDFLIASRIGADRSDDAAFIGMTLALRLGLLVLAAGGLAVYAFAVEPPGLARTVLLVLISALIGRGVAVWARVCFLAYERIGTFLPVVLILRLLEVGLGVMWLVNGGGLMSIVFLHAAFAVIEGGAGIVMGYSWLAKFHFEFAWKDAARFLRKGAVLGLAGALGMWLTMGPLVLLRVSGAELALIGQLGLALNVMMILVVCVRSFSAAAVPVLSRSVRRGDPRLSHYGRGTVLVSLGVGALAGIAGTILGVPLANVVLGPGFATSGALLGPCLFMAGIILAPSGYAQMLAAKGRRWPAVWAYGAGCALLVLALPLATAGWRGYGAIAALALAWAARGLVIWAAARRMEMEEARQDT